MNRPGMIVRASAIARALLPVVFITFVTGCAPMQKGPGQEAPTKTKGPGGIFAPFGRTERVTASRLNMRGGPSPEAEIIAVLEKGEAVKIKGRQGNWIKVRNREDLEGWVYGAYLTGIEMYEEEEKAGTEKGHEGKASGETGGEISDLKGPVGDDVKPEPRDRPGGDISDIDGSIGGEVKPGE